MLKCRCSNVGVKTYVGDVNIHVGGVKMYKRCEFAGKGVKVYVGGVKVLVGGVIF